MAQLKAADGTVSELKFDKGEKLDVAEHLAELLWKKCRFIVYCMGLAAILVSYFAVTYFAINAKSEMQTQVTVFAKEVTESRERIKTLVAQAEADISNARQRLASASRELDVKSKEISDVSKQFKQFPMQQSVPFAVAPEKKGK
jgi:septal ring factor EnvC (AmiA/AmiB activator)